MGRNPDAPVHLLIDADEPARLRTEAALARRFGSDYSVRAAANPEDGLAMLEQLRDQRQDLALVAADLRLPGIDGIEFLRRAHGLHPHAFRLLLVAMDQYHTRVPFTELPTLRRATALGQIDVWTVKGWVTPEEWLYPHVQAALTAWTLANRPHFAVYRFVGDQWSSRSHEIRDLFSRNGVPFEFHPTDSEEGRALIHEFGIDVSHLPAAVRHDGTVLHNPRDTELAVSHGIQVTPSRTRYDVVVVGAGPAGLSRCLLWCRHRRGAGHGRRGRVRCRRSELSRAGRFAFGEVRRSCRAPGPRQLVASEHVRVSHHPAGGNPQY